MLHALEKGSPRLLPTLGVAQSACWLSAAGASSGLQTPPGHIAPFLDGSLRLGAGMWRGHLQDGWPNSSQATDQGQHNMKFGFQHSK